MRNPNARVSDPHDFITDAGSNIHKLYNPRVYKDGRIELEENGEEDIQEMIDSYRDSTDMSFILHQLAIGNTSVLNQKSPMYGDFTQVPKTLAEAQQMLIDGEAAFMQLPLDTRQRFDNDFHKWLFESGSAEWLQKMSPVTDSDHGESPVDEVGEAKEGEN